MNEDATWIKFKTLYLMSIETNVTSLQIFCFFVRFCCACIINHKLLLLVGSHHNIIVYERYPSIDLHPEYQF